MKPRRILFVNTMYAPMISGGAEVILKTQAEAFTRAGYEVSVASLNDTSGSTRDVVNGVSVWRTELNNIYFPYPARKRSALSKLIWHFKDSFNSAMGRKLAYIIAKEEPDLVILHNLPGWSISAWKTIRDAKIPMIQILHDLYLVCPKTTMFSAHRNCIQQCTDCKFLRKNHAKASEAVDAVVGVSSFVLNRLQSFGYFKNSNASVIRNARSFEITAAKDPQPGVAARFGYIGGLAEYKGVELLLESFVALQRDDCILYLAGRGEPSYVALLVQKYKADNIKFLGYMNAQDFYPLVDVVVVPSLWNDTLPGVVFEAQLNGLPVIGSNRGGIPEMVTEDLGQIFDPVNQNDLVVCLGKFVSETEVWRNKRDYIKQAVFAYADEDAWILRWQELVERLIDDSRQSENARIR